MLDELRSRPDLIGGAHIPMNLFIFCSIYQGGGFPPTITKCYEKYLCNAIMSKSKKSSPVNPSLKHLPDDVKPLLAALGKLAFEGMKATPPTFVFEEDEVRHAFSSMVKADQTMGRVSLQRTPPPTLQHSGIPNQQYVQLLPHNQSGILLRIPPHPATK